MNRTVTAPGPDLPRILRSFLATANPRTVANVELGPRANASDARKTSNFVGSHGVCSAPTSAGLLSVVFLRGRPSAADRRVSTCGALTWHLGIT